MGNVKLQHVASPLCLQEWAMLQHKDTWQKLGFSAFYCMHVLLEVVVCEELGCTHELAQKRHKSSIFHFQDKVSCPYWCGELGCRPNAKYFNNWHLGKVGCI